MPTTIIQHLESKPGVRRGRLCLAGTRISVEDIVCDYVYQRMTVPEIVTAFNLSPAAVHAALAYYYDHQSEIEESIAADERMVEEMRQATPSLLAAKLKAASRG